MEAKNTVMSFKEYQIAMRRTPNWQVAFGEPKETKLEREFYEGDLPILEAQAEISFKASQEQTSKDDIEIIKRSFDNGKQTGIREVVEWIEERNALGLSSYLGEWVKKLKEWGIE